MIEMNDCDDYNAVVDAEVVHDAVKKGHNLNLNRQ